jgi:GGDEF domain-containing protein
LVLGCVLVRLEQITGVDPNSTARDGLDADEHAVMKINAALGPREFAIRLERGLFAVLVPCATTVMAAKLADRIKAILLSPTAEARSLAAAGFCGTDDGFFGGGAFESLDVSVTIISPA